MNLCLRIGLLAGLAASWLLADVSYEQTTKFTGGSLIEMTKKMASMPMIGRMGGGALKQAYEDQHFNIYLKGNKEARLGPSFSTIYDLDAGTMTSINNTKQTYSTETFDEMRERMEEMQKRMNRGSGQGGDIDFDVKADKTGNTRTINGEEASETVMTMTAKQAGANGQMVVKVHAWLVPLTPATQELIDFQKRLAAKFTYALGGFSPTMGAAGGGLAAAMKELGKQDGYPVLTDMEVSGLTSGGGPMAALGGGNSDPNAPLIQTEMQSSNFATGPVDDAKFSVPAGYKEEKRRH